MAFQPTATGYTGPVSSMELEGKLPGTAAGGGGEGGGGGGGGQGGPLTVVGTKGYGIQAPSAGPLAENYQNAASIARWNQLQTPGELDPGRQAEGMASAAGIARGQRADTFEQEMQSQQTQFGRLRLQALQKLLGLFGGAGAVGGGGMGGGSLDFNSILSGMRRESALPFEQERRALQSRIAAGGRQFSSASQNQLNMLNERQGLAGETAYSRAADVWSRQGLTPRFLAEMLQQETR